MAFTTITKTLQKAKPKVRKSDGVVKEWKIKVLLTNDGDGWHRSYDAEEDDLEYLNKQPEEFTTNELISYLDPSIDEIFEAHYKAHNTTPVDEELNDFEISNLAPNV